MKAILFVSVFLVSIFSQASVSLISEAPANPWAFGAGFGTENSYDSVSLLEIRTPILFSFARETNNVALVLSYETKELSGIDKLITPIHLLVELTTLAYKDMVRSYVRIGGGSVLIDDTAIYPASNFFNLQIQFGMDVITGLSEGGFGSSFFIQAMLNSPAIRNPPLGYATLEPHAPDQPATTDYPAKRRYK